MSQDSKVFFRIFLGIGLVLILISVVVFYNQFTYSKDAIHTEGVIVDTVWHSSHSHRTGKDGSWYPVVAFRPTPDYTLIFGNDSNLLIVFYVQIMPDDFVMQLHRF